MNKASIFFIFFLLLIGGNNSIVASNRFEENSVDSIVILGREPLLLLPVDIGRHDFIRFCQNNCHCHSKIINNRDSLNSIIRSINALEIKEVLPFSNDFHYKIILRKENVLFFNNDPLDVMMLVVVCLKTGENVPIWMDNWDVDIKSERYHNSDTLKKQLYNLLGYNLDLEF